VKEVHVTLEFEFEGVPYAFRMLAKDKVLTGLKDAVNGMKHATAFGNMMLGEHERSVVRWKRRGDEACPATCRRSAAYSSVVRVQSTNYDATYIQHKLAEHNGSEHTSRAVPCTRSAGA
jgi:hypothetical protein